MMQLKSKVLAKRPLRSIVGTHLIDLILRHRDGKKERHIMRARERDREREGQIQRRGREREAESRKETE